MQSGRSRRTTFVGDSTIGKIDRFFDLVETGIESVNVVLDRAERVEQARVRSVNSAKPTPSPVPFTPRARVIESIDATTGETVFVVTNGVKRREVTSRDLADRMKRDMEAGH